MSRKRDPRPRGEPAPFPLAIGAAHVELQNLLKAAGACESGGEAKHAIQAGQARVNGQVETRRSRKLVAGDLVAFRTHAWRVVPAA